MKRIFLDTETTGLEPDEGHRVIEVAAIAYDNQQLIAGGGGEFHCYFNPRREISEEAKKVHGMSMEELQDKPDFSAHAADLANFLRGAEVVIHNAQFDCAFLDAEFSRAGINERLKDIAGEIVCSLQLSRKLNPTLRRHSLEALCRHFGIDHSGRVTHSAQADIHLLAKVYMIMNRGQGAMAMNFAAPARARAPIDGEVKVIYADEAELAAHRAILNSIAADNQKPPLWGDGE